MGTLLYLGHSAFLLEGGGKKLIFDPFLTGNPLSQVKADELQVDYVLLTHGHGDHLGDGIELARRNKAVVIAPFELATYCERQGCQVHPMHIGGKFSFPFGTVRVTPALHGSAVITDKEIIYTGNPCGFVVGIEEKNLYFAGDTGIFYDMKLLGELEPLDIALLPIGGNFTMDISDAAKAVELLKPQLAIPMHFKTFDVIEADPQEFVRQVEKKGHKAKALAIGETLTF